VSLALVDCRATLDAETLSTLTGLTQLVVQVVEGQFRFCLGIVASNACKINFHFVVKRVLKNPNTICANFVGIISFTGVPV
jgi:hypothetical protein